MTGRVHQFGLRVIAAKKEIKEARRVKALATSVFWTDLKYVLDPSCKERCDCWRLTRTMHPRHDLLR